MADTTRMEMPNVACNDCGEKGNVCFQHWGELVPPGKIGNFCPSCMRERSEHFNADGIARPLGAQRPDQHEWRFRDGRYIHDGDCYFWQTDICTCGLIHHFLPEHPQDDWFGEEWARQHVQLDRVPRPLPYEPPSPEEVAERRKQVEEIFGGEIKYEEDNRFEWKERYADPPF